MKAFPHCPRHPENICWGCEKYCSVDHLACGAEKIRTPHPIEVLGQNWDLEPPALRVLAQEEIAQFIDVVAQLRLDIFREFPYLYDGDLNYERRYLSKFSTMQDPLIIVVEHEGQILGALTGLPLSKESRHIREPWQHRFGDPQSVFYLSEVLLSPVLRGKGFGKACMQMAEMEIQLMQRYRQICLATVIRSEFHPKRTKDDRDLAPFWRSLGYESQQGLVCHLAWKDVDEASETEKALQFWVKSI